MFNRGGVYVWEKEYCSLTRAEPADVRIQDPMGWVWKVCGDD